MPPKPAPKPLTKKEQKQLAAQQAIKKQLQQKKKQQEDEERQKQNKRLGEIEAQKRAQQQRRRIQTQKGEFSVVLNERIKNENTVLQEFNSQQEWSNSTNEYFKDYDVRGTNLSTFINIFRDQSFKSPEKSLQLCQQAQIIAAKLHQQILTYRSEEDYSKEKESLEATRQIHRIQMQKLEQIMIIMANEAEEMEQKNNELARNKGEPNRRVQGRKLLEYSQFRSHNFKIGMFLNSTTTKTVNKFRPIEIKQFGLNTEIPSKWINANTIVKFEWVNFDPFQTDEKEAFHIIGGAYNLEFYELLMGSKKINNITLKKLFKGKQILQKFKLQTSLIKQPFQLQYQLPQTVFLQTFTQNNLQFAQYDFSTAKWSILPNDTVQEYDQIEKKIVLKVARPEPIAYIQSRCLDYPYVAWELRMIKDDKVLLDIQLNRQLPKVNENDQPQRLILTFEISQNLVKLSLKDAYPQFYDLCETYRTPQNLLSELSRRGIHLLPQQIDYVQSRIPKKDPETESRAIRDIAYALEAFYIRSIPHETAEIVVKLRQNLDHQTIFLQDQQKDWKKIHWRNDRCWVSNRNIHQKHLNLEILLQEHKFTNSECLEVIKYDRKYLLKKAVMKMLSLTKILSFTATKQVPSKLRENIKQRILVA